MRILLCSLAVPWPSRPRLGIFHLHQARAVAALGGAMEIFGPGPAVPAWLGRALRRVRDHAQRPTEYEIDGVHVRAPRVDFAFPPFNRFHLARLAPEFLLHWAARAMRRELDAAIAEFRPDTLLAHGIVPFGEAALASARRAGIGCSFIEHSACDVMRLRPNTRLGRAATRCARAADAVFVVGAPFRDWLSRTMGWSNVVLLPNGAVRSTSPPPPRPTQFDGRFVVLSVANYYRRKGFEELVDAFDALAGSHPEADLHLVTEPPKRLLRRIQRSRAAARITVHAPMAPAALLGWMAWADLFALPSWGESFGLVYAEALAAGTPALATTDSGFACEAAAWTRDGHLAPALVVPPHDVPALTDALHRAMSDREALERSARSGARMVEERFTWERNARVLLDTLHERAQNCETNDDAGRPAAFSRFGSSAAPKA